MEPAKPQSRFLRLGITVLPRKLRQLHRPSAPWRRSNRGSGSNTPRNRRHWMAKAGLADVSNAKRQSSLDYRSRRGIGTGDRRRTGTRGCHRCAIWPARRCAGTDPAQVGQQGGSAETAVLDVADSKAVQMAGEGIAARHGRVDIWSTPRGSIRRNGAGAKSLRRIGIALWP